MSTPQLSPDDASALINHLLETKDPATVGLRRILKKKASEGEDFPLHIHSMSDFGSGGKGDKSGGVFNEDERHLLELEKRVRKLQAEKEEQRKKAEKAVQTAYQKGLAEGNERGAVKGRNAAQAQYDQQMQTVQERLAGILSDLMRSRRKMVLDSEKTLLDLAMNVARKVVNTELSTNQDAVVHVIKKALSYLADRDRLVVRVAPQDLETVSQKQDFWTATADRAEGITIESDDRISRGGCIIESASGVADARCETVLSELKDVIQQAWENTQASDDMRVAEADAEAAEAMQDISRSVSSVPPVEAQPRAPETAAPPEIPQEQAETEVPDSPVEAANTREPVEESAEDEELSDSAAEEATDILEQQFDVVKGSESESVETQNEDRADGDSEDPGPSDSEPL